MTALKTLTCFLEETPHRQRLLWNLLFPVFLLMTLTTGGWLWMARVGWTLLAMLFVMDLRYAIFSCFFFSAFFHPMGFFDPLFFTLKHFQMAFALGFIVATMKHGPGFVLNRMYLSFRRMRLAYPLFILFFLGLVVAVLKGAPIQTYRTIANVGLIFVAFIFIFGLLSHHEAYFKRGLFLFVFGVAVKVMIGLLNLVSGQNFLDLHLLHNNHMGALTAITLFYGLACCIAERKPLLRWFSTGTTLFVLIGLVFSCSRAAWFSVLLAGILFYVLIHQKAPKQTAKNIYRNWLFYSILFVFCAVCLGMFLNENIFQRVIYLHEILDPVKWEHAMHDEQNFGFLGIHRLVQLFEIRRIFQQNPFFGVGFQHHILDFHNLYFTILGATGLSGLLLFAFFCRNLMIELSRQISNYGKAKKFILCIAAFCALVVWFLGSIMQTLLVQFFIWLNIFFAINLIEFSKEAHERNSCSNVLGSEEMSEPDQ